MANIEKLRDKHLAKGLAVIARFETAGCKYIRTRFDDTKMIIEGSVEPFPPTAAMRDCVDCCRPFYSRSAGNVVCLVCKSESPAEFEGGPDASR